MPDNPAPRRRWFQFSLSTWFVLVALVAWAMAIEPRANRAEIIRVEGHRRIPITQQQIQQHQYLISLKKEGRGDWRELGTYKFGRKEFRKIEITRFVINPALLYPTLALAAFVGGKAAWLIVERRRNRRATH